MFQGSFVYYVIKSEHVLTSHECYIISNHWHLNSLFNSLFMRTTMNTSRVHNTGPLWGESTADNCTPIGLPTQRAGDVESISMSWCHSIYCVRSSNPFCLFQDVIYLVLLSFTLGWVCQFFCLPAMFGYILSGLILGPSGANVLKVSSTLYPSSRSPMFKVNEIMVSRSMNLHPIKL